LARRRTQEKKKRWFEERGKRERPTFSSAKSLEKRGGRGAADRPGRKAAAKREGKKSRPPFSQEEGKDTKKKKKKENFNHVLDSAADKEEGIGGSDSYVPLLRGRT